MSFVPDDGTDATNLEVFHFKDAGVMLSMYNTDESITEFAHSCFKYAL